MKKYMNGNFTTSNINEEVILYGWVSKIRNLGGLIFIDLRDKSGIIQLVINPDNKNYNEASLIKAEYVLKVEGKIKLRSNPNKEIKTGAIEVEVKELDILSKAYLTPFEITNDVTALEETRLKYRYLDLRTINLQEKLFIRHKFITSVRGYLNNLDFTEIETPILTKSTPEGARDYLVPSRINKGTFYALPQSPQIFKQLLMVSGFEKYYQIAKCFRDEDLRSDRQPEFTQVDIEMSFINEEDIFEIIEGMFKKIFMDVLNIEINTPFKKMTYSDTITYYGTDKPDLRFDMKLIDITAIFKSSNFSIFNEIINDNGVIKCIKINDDNYFTRKKIDELTLFVKKYKAKMLMYLSIKDNNFTGSLKNLDIDILNKIKAFTNLENNEILFIIGGQKEIVEVSLGALRSKLGSDLNLINKNSYEFLWVVDFPLLEYNEEDKRYYAKHHPFTSPNIKNLNELENPANVLARAYDIVLNGYEIGGGSIRIHDKDMQETMFNILGLTNNEIEEKFGFLLEAFKYGTPPHGGIALGVDRITMLLSNTENIRDVIAFPKTQKASCLMSEAPNNVSDEQLEELGIMVINNE